jgi:hypothetical protein
VLWAGFARPQHPTFPIFLRSYKSIIPQKLLATEIVAVYRCENEDKYFYKSFVTAKRMTAFKFSGFVFRMSFR